jgi:hypothetical protein
MLSPFIVSLFFFLTFRLIILAVVQLFQTISDQVSYFDNTNNIAVVLQSLVNIQAIIDKERL